MAAQHDRPKSQGKVTMPAEVCGLPVRRETCILRHMIAETIPQLRTMTPEEKMLLAGELWDDVAAHAGSWEPDPEFVAGMQQQLEEYRRDPSVGRTWEQLKANILARKP
jgi:putative addiction module component (TIGR02574 family)